MNSVTLTSSFTPELLSEFDKYNLIQDRLAGDQLQLPNNFYDIKIKVNDFVVAETINYSLEKLYINSLYILSKSVIPSNNIPETRHYKYIANDTGSGINWKGLEQWDTTSPISSNRSMHGVKKMIKLDNVANPNDYNIVATTSTNVILLSGTGVANIDIIVNPDIPTITSNSDITHPSNGVRFQNIQDITISESNSLFVLDSTLGTIFKFDISGMLTLDDAVLKNDTPGRLMTGMMGNIGELSDKTKFLNPVAMTSVNDLIYVVDYDAQSGSSAIKVFDSELNWKHTKNLGQSLSAGPVDIKYNSDIKEMFILCHLPSYNNYTNQTSTTTTGMPEIVRFDVDTLILTKSDNFYSESRHGTDLGGEIYRSINFSIENPNIMYIMSNYNMYKKYVTRPELFVGNFLIGEKNIGTGNSTDMNFQDFTIQPTTLTLYDEHTSQYYTEFRDEIMIFDGVFETIHKFLEASNYEKSLQSDIESNFISFENLKIAPDELVSVFVYNKSILKALYNNVLILENVSRVFTTLYNNIGISKYIGFTYLTDKELGKLTYEQSMNNLIGINEPVMTSPVNRCLNEIYKLQLQILELVQEKSINDYPLIDTPVNLT